MPAPLSTGYALNRTRHAYLARHLRIADTHWSRFCGLMGTEAGSFPAGQGLWIVPSRGVHTFAMRFPIDVIYLDSDKSCCAPRRKSEAVAPRSASAACHFSTRVTGQHFEFYANRYRG